MELFLWCESTGLVARPNSLQLTLIFFFFFPMKVIWLLVTVDNIFVFI